MTDRAFANWPMKATGGSTGRTLPDRLSDIVNVKDHGAVGDGVAQNDDLGINAAIQYAILRGRTVGQALSDGWGGGTVFFPTGQYKINAPIMVGHNSLSYGVRLVGAGKNQASVITLGSPYVSGGVGYLISKGTYTNDCLEAVSGLCQVWIQATRDDVLIEDCSTNVGQNGTAIEVSLAKNATVRDCQILGSTRTAANEGSLGGGLTTGQFFPGSCPGAVGVNLGNGTVTGCRGPGLDICICMSGYGSTAVSNSFEGVGCAVRVGYNSRTRAEEASYGAVVEALQTEKAIVGIELYNATACYIGGGVLTSAAPSPASQVFTGGTFSAGLATLQVGAAGHGLPAGISRITFTGGDNGTWLPTVSGSSDHIGENITDVTRVDATRFSYHLSATPAAFVPGALGWSWPPRYAFRARKAYDCVISNFGISAFGAAFAGIDLNHSDGGVEHKNNVIEAVDSPYGWRVPTDATNLASWKFIHCRGGGLTVPYNNGALVFPQGTMVFANLPGQTSAGVVKQAGPFEGQEFDIVDGSPGSAAFDATISGGGSGKYKVRWSSTATAWKRIG
jgi:Pectate lyase superfamily protein